MLPSATGSLNYAPGDANNPLRPVKADSNTVILLPLSGGTADMARPAAGLVPVENDPFRTCQLTAVSMKSPSAFQKTLNLVEKLRQARVTFQKNVIFARQ
jgi:hypothetical protein